VSGLLEATLREKLKFQRPWIMKVCHDANRPEGRTANVMGARAKAKGLAESSTPNCNTTSKSSFPSSATFPTLHRRPEPEARCERDGPDRLSATEVQSLIIQSVLGWVYES
jgi:hypothetical protein